jgi:hypothetical protein
VLACRLRAQSSGCASWMTDTARSRQRHQHKPNSVSSADFNHSRLQDSFRVQTSKTSKAEEDSRLALASAPRCSTCTIVSSECRVTLTNRGRLPKAYPPLPASGFFRSLALSSSTSGFPFRRTRARPD